MCLWFPLYKPGNILYEAGSILNRSLIRASNIKGNYSCDGLYEYYLPSPLPFKSLTTPFSQSDDSHTKSLTL